MRQSKETIKPPNSVNPSSFSYIYVKLTLLLSYRNRYYPLATIVPDRKNRRRKEYRQVISDSCMKNSSMDRMMEGGLNGAADRSILGGLAAEVLLIRWVSFGCAILGESVLDR
jgi:hypothetical protein